MDPAGGVCGGDGGSAGGGGGDGVGGGFFSWDRTRTGTATGQGHASVQPSDGTGAAALPAEQRPPHHQPPAQPTYPVQSCNSNSRPVSKEGIDGASWPSSFTPFRPMQPREFSLGGNLRRRVHPAMPLPSSLPADVSGSVNAVKALKDAAREKARAEAAKKPPLAQVVPIKTSGGDDNDGRRSSIYSRRTSLGAISMEKISEISEEEDTGSSETMSSGFSSAMRKMRDSATPDCDDIVGDIISQLQAAHRSSRGKDLEKLADVDGSPGTPGADHDARPREATSGDRNAKQPRGCLVGDDSAASKSLPTDEVEVKSMADDSPLTAHTMFGLDTEAIGKLNPLPLAGPDDKSTNSVSEDGDDDESDSDGSSGSFLSWDRSRASHEYARAKKESAERRQDDDDLRSSPQPQQQSLTGLSPWQQLQRKHSDQHSHPPRQQHATQQHLPTPAQQQSYDRKPSQGSYNRKTSQESNDSSYEATTHSPTPFRPMLPRELSPRCNLRNMNRGMPLPSVLLPADSSSNMNMRGTIRSTNRGGNRGGNRRSGADQSARTNAVSSGAENPAERKSVTPQDSKELMRNIEAYVLFSEA